MAANTKYYHLTKPEGIDLVEVGDLNGNFDIIDGQMKANADATAGKQDALPLTARQQLVAETLSQAEAYTQPLG